MAGKSTTLVIRILADATQAAGAMRRAAGNTGKFASGLNKATVPALAMVGALGVMGKAAAEDAKGQALLANSLRKSAGATTAQVAATEDWITKTTLATGVADDQLRPALATLTRATGDVTASQKAMATVMDVSAATGKDTEAVANAVAKAYAGNTTSLGKMVPGMNKAILKSGDMTKIMGELARMTGGSAAVAADTAAGKWQRTQVAFNETKESIGAGLLPVMEAASGKMAAFGGWAANNTGTVTKLAVAFGILSAAVLVTRGVMAVYNTVQSVSIALQKAYAKEGLVYAAVQGVIRVATLAWVAVQWLLNAALTANPIGIVIVVIAALVAAIVIAYKKSDTFRAIVQGAFRAVVAAGVWLKNALIVAFNAVKTALSAVVKFVSTYVVNPIKAYFRAVVEAAKLMASAVGAAWSGMKAALQAVLGWINSNVIGPLKNAFASVVDAVRAVIDWIGRIKIPSAVSKIIGKIGGVFSVAPAPPAPAPTVSTRRGGGRAGTRAADQPALGPGGTRDPLAALTVEPEVIVQVSDRKMAQLVDVSVRANATSAARNLTRRRVVTV